MESVNENAYSGESSVDRLLQGDNKVDVFGCVRQAWALYLQEIVKLVGFSFVLYVVSQMILLFLIAFALGFAETRSMHNPAIREADTLKAILFFIVLPVLGAVPLFFGGSIVAFKMMSSQEIRVNDFFSGYRYWISLALSAIAQGLVIAILFGVVGIVYTVVTGIFGHSFFIKKEFYPYIEWTLFLAASVVSGYGIVIYIFSQLLVIDQRFGVWQAMNMSRKVVMRLWFKVFLLLVVMMPLNLSGFFNYLIFHDSLVYFVFLVWLLVVIPLSCLMPAVAYREIFGLQREDW